ncbi:family 10 glycosylhydrolase [soil metagenome]
MALAACADIPAGNVTAAPRLLPAPELAALAPPAPREFRAAWVATVTNIDWPSKKGLTSAQQQAEMRVLLDQAVALNLNAIILQIRTSADAFYPSRLEPWSEYLTGTQGQPPSPLYDPLALWIAEAHQRGLELHAWLNPFRARQSMGRSEAHASHLSRTQPQWVKRYGDQLWIDPGEPAAADHTVAVFKDVLQRYDVDGIHIDDYFYPYPIPVPGSDPLAKLDLDFPDDQAWLRFLTNGGNPMSPPAAGTQPAPRGGQAGLGSGPAPGLLSRADWRRQNVDQLIERLHNMIRATKPQVRFGISPFGLGKPALRPEGIAGFSQYDKLYADAERWLAEGWLDYLVPQLYWPMAQKPQAFGVLLDYWLGQNPKGRHVWPGLFTSRITDKPESWPVAEIVGQIAAQRERAPASSGHAHFSIVALKENRRGLSDALKAGPYATPALVPASPWLGISAPVSAVPVLTALPGGLLQLRLAGRAVQTQAVWLKYGERWEFRIGTDLRLTAAGLNGIVVSAVDRVGNEGRREGYSIR